MQRQQLVSMLGLALALIALVTSGVTWSRMHRSTVTQNPPPHEVPPEILAPPAPQIELGTYMATLARRASTLWFAAKAGNQAAADYEITEMGEVMNQIIAAAPVLEDVNDVNIAGVLDALRNTHFEKLRGALHSGDPKAFEAEYTAMLGACNDCHQSANRQFIRLKVPERAQITNRDWSAGKK